MFRRVGGVAINAQHQIIKLQKEVQLLTAGTGANISVPPGTPTPASAVANAAVAAGIGIGGIAIAPAMTHIVFDTFLDGSIRIKRIEESCANLTSRVDEVSAQVAHQTSMLQQIREATCGKSQRSNTNRRPGAAELSIQARGEEINKLEYRLGTAKRAAAAHEDTKRRHHDENLEF